MQWFSALLALCVGNSPVTGEFLLHRPVTWSLDFFICTWINGWVNNHGAGDLRCHHIHYDITAMKPYKCSKVLQAQQPLLEFYHQFSWWNSYMVCTVLLRQGANEYMYDVIWFWLSTASEFWCSIYIEYQQEKIDKIWLGCVAPVYPWRLEKIINILLANYFLCIIS